MTATHLGASRITGPDACGNILLVGESNPYGGDPRYALYNEPATSAGGRLQRLIFGIEGRRWYLPMWRVNLCVGDFEREAAKRRALELLGEAPWTTIVLLGRQVQHAFDVALPKGFSFSTIFDRERAKICVPHPSGRNAALWGNPDNVKAARDHMRRVAPEIPWGQLDAAAAPQEQGAT